jgi:hypothetical protein
MFDIQAIPGAVGNAVDWEKLENDLADLNIGLDAPAHGDFLCPWFEMAIGEMGALQQLLYSLDARTTDLIAKHDADGPADAQLQNAQSALEVARDEFISAFERLTSCYGLNLAAHVQGRDEKRVLQAIHTLQETQAIWSSHRGLQSSNV